MEAQWHYNKKGQQSGPVSTTELKSLVLKGEITQTDMVWKDGMEDWVSAEKINELFVASDDTTLTNSFTPPPLLSNVSSHKLIMGRNRQRFSIAVAAGSGILATFLPWLHAPIIGTVSGTSGDGWITLILFLPALILALRGNKLEPISGGARIGAVIPAAIASLIGFFKVVSFNAEMGKVASNNIFGKAMSMSVQIGIGIYILVAAGAAIAILAWVLAKEPKK
jgi:hypothetical protein